MWVHNIIHMTRIQWNTRTCGIIKVSSSWFSLDSPFRRTLFSHSPFEFSQCFCTGACIRVFSLRLGHGSAYKMLLFYFRFTFVWLDFHNFIVSLLINLSILLMLLLEKWPFLCVQFDGFVLWFFVLPLFFGRYSFFSPISVWGWKFIFRVWFAHVSRNNVLYYKQYKPNDFVIKTNWTFRWMLTQVEYIGGSMGSKIEKESRKVHNEEWLVTF